MLPKRDKQTIMQFLSGINHKENIEVVTMDMWKPYKDAVSMVLPNAIIVVDKFHVIKEINVAMEKIRRKLNKEITKQQRSVLRNSKALLLGNPDSFTQKQKRDLATLLSTYPVFKQPYASKEMLRNVYSFDNKDEAQAYYESIKDMILEYTNSNNPNGYGLEFFIPVIKMINNWKKEIFAYFDYQYTNAATENINKEINAIGNAGKGYSFEILRAKCLFKSETKTPPKFVYKVLSDK